MNKHTGFSDLCVPYTESSKDLLGTLTELIELGYKNVAIEQVYDHINYSGDKKNDPIPAAVDLSVLNKQFKGRLRLLNRLTIIYADASVTLSTNRSANLRKFNVVAVIPTTEDAFQHACQTMHCDIISYNSDTVRNKMSRKYYFLAVSRNIMFELKYAPAIVSSIDRKDTINRAHRYHSYGKSNNVVITSEARNRFQVRGPYDIANLGLIFGLSEEQSKSAILALPRKILIAAEARRHGKAGLVLSYRQNAVDSDDYSDSELDEEISTSEEGDEEEEEREYVDTLIDEIEEPPKKVAKLSSK
ncbi:ribonuclease P protein subunit p30 [Toxorhynchites rutilus septentrionalis]|uniref:ribonuclease P protein subunit p30 n=1 Tax=Toxorhynchites rutilus septentrionalis TaxID=329112 RepID=UPI00247AAFE9|nr:ribonuclease P protein subunit p30 [Toxorhynchites rutilus septentrionalis]